MTGARLKAIAIPLDTLVAMLREPGMSMEVAHHHLPEDTISAGAYIDHRGRRLVIHLHSETFEPIPEDSEPPMVVPPALLFKSAEFRQREGNE